MQWLQSLLFLSLLSFAAVLGAPSAHQNRPRTFKVDLVRRSNYVPNGLAAIKKAYAKFGIIPSDINFGSMLDLHIIPTTADRTAVKQAEAPDENGAVQNVPAQNDVEYLSPVTIGGQEFVMNFDTGSADTWVFNTLLDQSQTAGHAIFDPAKSTTFTELEGATFNITYGDASFAGGNVGLDTVDIGGATVQKQAIGLPTEVSESFATDEASDGLVGLAFTTINTMQPEAQTTFLENLAPDLDEPVFTAQLKAGKPGSYEFGKIDPAKFAGEMINIPVDNSRGFWEIQSSMFMVEGDEGITTVSGASSTTAIADTGTTLMLVNLEIAEAYYAKVQGSQNSPAAGGFIYPCETELPDLMVSIGDTHLARVTGDLINFATVGTDTTTNQELCFGGIQSNQGAGLQIWGDIFFKSIFVTFDLRGPSLGMAAHA
ncbi:hypothetical protein FQN53_002394 [Emmonsiellopsis sp. PD_33]|nr:hypothetical protein FQN53_002394 [Emmonsiellopsis sp. PD_33]